MIGDGGHPYYQLTITYHPTTPLGESYCTVTACDAVVCGIFIRYGDIVEHGILDVARSRCRSQ